MKILNVFTCHRVLPLAAVDCQRVMSSSNVFESLAVSVLVFQHLRAAFQMAHAELDQFFRAVPINFPQLRQSRVVLIASVRLSRLQQIDRSVRLCAKFRTQRLAIY